MKTKNVKKQMRILKKVANGKLSSPKAYQKIDLLLTKQKERKAHFIKIKVKTNESRGTNIFLGMFLWLPIPIWLVSVFLKDKYLRDTSVSAKEFIRMIKSKDIVIDIRSRDGTVVKIKFI